MRAKAAINLILKQSVDSGKANFVLKNFRYSTAVTAIILYTAVATIVIWAPPRWGNVSGLASLIDKHAKLESIGATKSKVILVGGSNVSVGTDSQILENGLQLDVVNMGLGVSLGLRYMLSEISDQIKVGDLLVIIPEYDLFCRTKKSESNAQLNGTSDLIHLFQVYPRAGQWMLSSYSASPAHFYGLVEDLQAFLKFKINFYKKVLEQVGIGGFFKNPDLFQPQNSIYTRRQNYNRYGDFIGHLNLPPPGFPSSSLLPFTSVELNAEGFELLNEFCQLAANRGARAVIVPPPVPSESYALRKELIAKIFSRWQSIKAATLLGSAQEYSFAQNEFFDTPYHLNADGRHHRSTLLLKDLQTYLKTH